MRRQLVGRLATRCEIFACVCGNITEQKQNLNKGPVGNISYSFCFQVVTVCGQMGKVQYFKKTLQEEILERKKENRRKIFSSYHT